MEIRSSFRIAVLVCSLVVAGCGPDSGLFALALSLERSLANLELRSIEVDGQDIAYLEREADGEAIVLVHGFAADKDNWVRFARRLPRGYRVIALDLPGHGDSSFDPNATYDATTFAKSLTRVAEELDLAQFHLVGNSLGGWIATLYAADNPNKVLTLSLIDSAGVVPPKPSELQLAMLDGDNPLLVETEEDFERLMDFVFYRQPFLPWPLRPAMARSFTQRSAINRKIWDDVSANLDDVVPLLGTLSMPVLVVWGEQDRVLHVSSVDVYRRHVPDIRTVVMTECGHAPMAERPDETAGYVTGFLAGEYAAGLRITTPRASQIDVQLRTPREQHSR